MTASGQSQPAPPSRPFAHVRYWSKSGKAQKEQMFSGVPGKRASAFALMSTRLDSKATAGPIPCAVSTVLTGVLTCLHVHIRVHLFTRKPNFFSCAASVPARGCPPHGFFRQGGPANCTPDVPFPRLIKPHIGGVMPSRPTEMVAASSVPSSFLLAAAMKILAPGLSSLLSAGT
jgi:hypothetical protein